MYREHRSPADAAMAARSVGATRAYTPREAIVEDRGVIQGLSRRGKTRAEIIELLMRGKPQHGRKGRRERDRVYSLVRRWFVDAPDAAASGGAAPAPRSVLDAPRSGRPRALDATTRARIPAMLKRGRSTPNAVKLAKKLDVSPQTVRRAAREAGLCFKRPRPQQPLTAAQRAERLAFAKHWLKILREDPKRFEEQFTQALFTDEKWFSVGEGHWGGKWTQTGVTIYSPKLRGQPARVNAFGVIGRRVRFLCLAHDTDNTTGMSYRQLSLPVIERMAKLHRKRCKRAAYVVEDNAPAHSAYATVEAHERQGTLLITGPEPVGTATKRPRLRFPPNSNDLNIIENIWAELALAIAAMRKPPRTQAELKAACLKQWANYPAERLERHLKSLPKRLRAVVKAHGGYTKY